MERIEQVRPGDVLLVKGHGFIPWAIRFFDGTEVNHAAVALDSDELAEAGGDGLRDADIGPAVRHSEFVVVRRLKTTNDLRPVVEVARSYVESGIPYAYQQILLLGALSLTRRVPLRNPLLRQAIRRTLDRAAELLNSLVDSGRTLMICSEFVYRCYDEVLPGRDDYSLEIPVLQTAQPVAHTQRGSLLADLVGEPAPTAARSLAPGRSPDAVVADATAELEPLYAAFAAQVDASLETRGEPTFGLVPEVTDKNLHQAAAAFAAAAGAARAAHPAPPADFAWNAQLQAVADFVTPGDLLRTPSLHHALTLRG